MKKAGVLALILVFAMSLTVFAAAIDTGAVHECDHDEEIVLRRGPSCWYPDCFLTTYFDVEEGCWMCPIHRHQ